MLAGYTHVYTHTLLFPGSSCALQAWMMEAAGADQLAPDIKEEDTVTELPAVHDDYIDLSSPVNIPAEPENPDNPAMVVVDAALKRLGTDDIRDRY